MPLFRIVGELRPPADPPEGVRGDAPGRRAGVDLHARPGRDPGLSGGQAGPHSPPARYSGRIAQPILGVGDVASWKRNDSTRPLTDWPPNSTPSPSSSRCAAPRSRMSPVVVSYRISREWVISSK